MLLINLIADDPTLAPEEPNATVVEKNYGDVYSGYKISKHGDVHVLTTIKNLRGPWTVEQILDKTRQRREAGPSKAVPGGLKKRELTSEVHAEDDKVNFVTPKRARTEGALASSLSPSLGANLPLQISKQPPLSSAKPTLASPTSLRPAPPPTPPPPPQTRRWT